MATITCSGDMPPNAGLDLRILLRIRETDGLEAICKTLSGDDRDLFEKMTRPYRAAITSLRSVGIEWRGIDPSRLMPSKHIAAAYSALELADRCTKHIQTVGEYDNLSAISRMFSSAEWDGIRVNLDAAGVSEEFRDSVRPHCLDGKIHPQIDVVPKELTERMGTRGGFNVMSWKRSERSALESSAGNMIYSIDFNSMDLHSLAVIDESGVIRSIIGDSDDGYSELALSSFGTLSPEIRAITKGSFLPMAYGASDRTIARSLGISENNASRLREKYRVLDSFPIGSDLARLTQQTSSSVFRECLAAVARNMPAGCRALFPVHDELILEASSGESVREISSVIESTAKEMTGIRFPTKVKAGPSYASLS